MPEINISVENKIATKTDDTEYICGNSDFVAKFAFDSEWDAYDTKTARFIYNGRYTDVVFSGNQCPVPIITDAYFFNIGVYAGNLHTTTSARVPCKLSILCGTGTPADPPDDVYNQIMARLAEIGSVSPEDVAQAVADYITAHPIAETDPTVHKWAKAAEKPTYTAAEVGAATESDVTNAVDNAWQAAVDLLNPILAGKQDKGDYLTADALQAATDAALAQAKASGAFDGAPGTPGVDGAPGKDGTDGITPTIGDNGNWYLGTTDTGKPARGPTGSPGPAYTLTAADKQTIVDDVLDALPTWSGGSY